MNLIARCANCDKSAKNCGGPCACTIDGKDILQHAQERYCPIGRYRLGLGDVVAMLTHRLGIQRLLRRFTKQKTCGGCKARQLALNNINKD